MGEKERDVNDWLIIMVLISLIFSAMTWFATEGAHGQMWERIKRLEIAMEEK